MSQHDLDCSRSLLSFPAIVDTLTHTIVYHVDEYTTCICVNSRALLARLPQSAGNALISGHKLVDALHESPAGKAKFAEALVVAGVASPSSVPGELVLEAVEGRPVLLPVRPSTVCVSYVLVMSLP